MRNIWNQSIKYSTDCYRRNVAAWRAFGITESDLTGLRFELNPSARLTGRVRLWSGRSQVLRSIKSNTQSTFHVHFLRVCLICLSSDLHVSKAKSNYKTTRRGTFEEMLILKPTSRVPLLATSRDVNRAAYAAVRGRVWQRHRTHRANFDRFYRAVQDAGSDLLRFVLSNYS